MVARKGGEGERGREGEREGCRERKRERERERRGEGGREEESERERGGRTEAETRQTLQSPVPFLSGPHLPVSIPSQYSPFKYGSINGLIH
jgi:hypothetical protein